MAENERMSAEVNQLRSTNLLLVDQLHGNRQDDRAAISAARAAGGAIISGKKAPGTVGVYKAA